MPRGLARPPMGFVAARRMLELIVLEPRWSRWEALRRGFAARGLRCMAVQNAAELAVTLDAFSAGTVVIGPHGTAAEHSPVVDRLRDLPRTRVLVVSDAADPRRIAAYLRLGPGVRVVDPIALESASTLARIAGLGRDQD